MKLTKRAWMGLSAAASAITMSGSTLYFWPSGASETTPPGAAAVAPSPEVPISISAELPDDAMPANPIRQVDFTVPSPADTVVRGNDPPGQDPLGGVSDAGSMAQGADPLEPPPFDPMPDSSPAPAAEYTIQDQSAPPRPTTGVPDAPQGYAASIQSDPAPSPAGDDQAYDPYSSSSQYGDAAPPNAANSPNVDGFSVPAANGGYAPSGAPSAIRQPESQSPAYGAGDYGQQFQDAPADTPMENAAPPAAPSELAANQYGQPAGRYEDPAGSYQQPASQYQQAETQYPQAGTQSQQPETQYAQAGTQLSQAPNAYDQPAPQQGASLRTASAAAAVGAAALVAASPGPRQLEGAQSPSLAIEKVAPEEIQVNIPAVFEIIVRNVGQITAREVVLSDTTPKGTQLVSAKPQPTQGADGLLVWQLGDLEPSQEVVVSVELLPQAEGEIGSVAQVTFQAQASVRTVCTRPMLTVEHSAPSRVLIGDDVVFAISIKNPGSGDAMNVVIEEDVPPGLSHAAGRALEYELGTLQAGEERNLELVLKASEAGMVENLVRIRGSGDLVAEDRLQLEVTAPQLQVGVRGPTRRYLERQVTYDILIGNPGTASATNVDLVTYLPKGLEFVAADSMGKYDSQSHAVLWSLAELPADQNGAVQLTALPIETGDQMLRVEGRADLALAHQHDHTTLVEGLTELEFTVKDLQDPIEVGSETTYEIRIQNRGSKAATNVQLSAALPPQITPLAADGTTQVVVQGQRVQAEVIQQLAPQSEAVYRIKVQGREAGDHLIDVQLVSDEVRTPVTKQESTKVYADR